MFQNLPSHNGLSSLPDLTGDCRQVALGRYDQQTICAMELILCYFAPQEGKWGKYIKASDHHVVYLFMTLDPNWNFRIHWPIFTKFLTKVMPVNDIPATYILTYDQRTALASLIGAFYTGLHKYFRILGARWMSQDHIIL